jgi:hypothetical protein
LSGGPWEDFLIQIARNTLATDIIIVGAAEVHPNVFGAEAGLLRSMIQSEFERVVTEMTVYLQGKERPPKITWYTHREYRVITPEHEWELQMVR